MEQRKHRARARHPISCRDCGAEVIAFRSDARCPGCKATAVRRKWQEHEKRCRHPCPSCGTEIARSSKQCRTCGQKDRTPKISGPNNYAWKGGRSRDNKGYVHLLVSPEKRKGHRYQPEHRVVWEAAHGPLAEGWIVHHINGVKDDNRLENLKAASRHDHTRGDKRIEHLEAELVRLKELREKREGFWKS